MRVEVDDVERVGGVAGDEGPHPGQAAERARDDGRADLADDVLVADVVAAAGHEVGHERDVAVGGHVRRRRPAETRDRQDRIGHLLDGCPGRRLVRVRHDHRQVEIRTGWPFLVEQIDRLHAVQRVGERGEVRLAHVEAQYRRRHDQ